MAGTGSVESMSFLHSNPEFVFAVMRIFRIDSGSHHSSGSHQFDDIRTGMNLFPDGLDHFIRPVRNPAMLVSMTSGHTDDLTCGTDGRTELFSGIAGIPDGKFEKIPAAEVPQGSGPPGKALLRIRKGPHNNLAGFQFHHLCSRIGFSAIDQMDMTVDQSRKQRSSTDINNLTVKTGKFGLGSNSLDLLILNQHGMIIQGGTHTVKNPASAEKCTHLIFCVESSQ